MKKVTITSKNISPKQWNVLLLELHLMKRAWNKYAKIDIHTPGINKVIKWGTKKYDEKDD